MKKERVLRIEYDQGYPWLTILVAMVLIFASPFVSSLLNYAALAICLYRAFRYNAKIFATDYAILAPVAYIFSTSGGLTLLIILGLLATALILVREGMKADAGLVLILALLNYLLLRMQTNFSKYLLCFGQLFLLWVLLPKQDAESAERTAKLYCISLLAASGYALLLNNTWQIQALIGAGSEAFWGTGIMRFHGLVGDPNFYMTQVVVALALLAKLKETDRIKTLPFILMGIALTAMGILTYSKTFFLVFVMLGAIYIIWQFRNRKVILGVLLVMAVVLAADFLLFSEASPFAVVLERLMQSEDLSDLTTGRTDVYLLYLRAITRNPWTILFGYGFSAPGMEYDPHNIYLEIVYYSGIVGLGLIIALFAAIINQLKQKEPLAAQQGWIAKYITLTMFLVMFLALNGMFMVIVYPSMFLACLAVLIPPKQED